MLIVTLLFILTTGQSHATNRDYATEKWWDYFWSTSEGWGEPNSRVTSLLKSLDGSKKIITVVDIGAGNGRNSILALEKLFKNKKPKSCFVVHCIDTSEEALQSLRSRSLPDWLQLTTHNININLMTSDTLPKTDLLLLYGILEYVEDKKLSYVFNLASQALNPRGFLVVVTLVQGKGALEIEGELVRPADMYTRYLEALKNVKFVDYPEINIKHDRHDLGKGYPEDHIHYVYRSVMIKGE